MVMQVMMRRGLFVSGEAGGPLAIPSAPLAQLLTHLPGKRVLLGPARVSLTSVHYLTKYLTIFLQEDAMPLSSTV